jgi:Flp pilus assembly protein TadD
MEVSRSLLSPATTLPAVIGLGALVLAFLFFLRRRPLTAFGIGFFLTALVPEAVAVPQNLYFPQRISLPMAGALLVLVDQLLTAMAWGRKRGRYTAIAASAALVALVWLGFTVTTTVTRAAMWRNPVLVWKDSVDAFSEKETNLEKFPRVSALNGMGEALRRAGRPEEAIAFHQRAAKVEPRNLQSWKDLAAAYWLTNRFDDAHRAFEEAAKLDRKDATIRSNLGAVLLKQNRIEEAVQRYRQAVQLRPSDASLRRALSFALLAQGSVREAVEQLDAAIRLQHKGLQAAADHANLGKLLMDLGKTDEAIVHLKKAVAMAPRMWQAQNNLGTALLLMGRPQEAVAHFQKALALNPASKEIRWNLDRAMKSESNGK